VRYVQLGLNFAYLPGGRGVARLGVARRGVACRGVARRGVALLGVARNKFLLQSSDSIDFALLDEGALVRVRGARWMPSSSLLSSAVAIDHALADG